MASLAVLWALSSRLMLLGLRTFGMQALRWQVRVKGVWGVVFEPCRMFEGFRRYLQGLFGFVQGLKSALGELRDVKLDGLRMAS